MQALDALLERIIELGTEERAIHDVDYLKSELEHMGLAIPDARKTAKWLLKEYPDIRADPWPLVHACWATEIYDVRSVMSFYLERATLGDNAMEELEKILRNSLTWALVDQIAVQVVPRAKPDHATLKRWATDDDMWLRRAALLAELKDLRAGKGNPGRWADLAKPNLADESQWIRKTIGWVLREIGKKRPDWVDQYIEENREQLSALSIREATRILDD